MFLPRARLGFRSARNRRWLLARSSPCNLRPCFARYPTNISRHCAILKYTPHEHRCSNDGNKKRIIHHVTRYIFLIGKEKRKRISRIRIKYSYCINRVLHFLLPINYSPAYHSNTLVILTAQYRFRKQTRIRRTFYTRWSRSVRPIIE